MQCLFAPCTGKGCAAQRTKDDDNPLVYSTFYWEIIVYLEKVALCALAVFLTGTYIEMQLQIALVVLILFTAFNILNSPYHSDTLNRLNNLSYYSGVIYLLGRLCIRSLGPSQTQLEKESLGVKSRGPLREDLLDVSDIVWDEEMSDKYLTIAVWVTFGLIVAIEAYFVWRLYLQSLESFTRVPKCHWLVRIFTCCCCSRRDFRQVIMQESFSELDDAQKKGDGKDVEKVLKKDEKGKDASVDL